MKFEYEKPEPKAEIIDAEITESPLAVLDKDPFAAPEAASQYSYKPAVNVTDVLSRPITEMSEADSYKMRLSRRPEVIALTNEIDISNPRTIEMFGQKAGAGISRISDALLENTQAVRSKEISEMMVNLTSVMKKFDAAELSLEDMSGKRGIWGRFRTKARESLEAIVAKYDTLGKDVDRIAQTLTRYMTDIDSSNKNLLKMYDANAQYYKALECYVVAADLGLEEIQQEMARIQAETDSSEEEKSFKLKKLQDIYYRLEQRKLDLQTAEMVALQMQPTLAVMMNSNYQLMGKINTSFIITLPVFKISLANAVMLKRQEIQAKSIQQLDDATNELLRRNAANSMSQAKDIAKMANTSGIKVETLETIQQTILNGISETDEIMKQASIKRKEDSAKLDSMAAQMRSKGFGAGRS